MARWASGVTVATTVLEGQWKGMTASSFISLSIDPLLVAVSIGKHLNTHDIVAASRVFAINMLNAEQIEWGKRFAGMLPEVTDRFEGISCKTAVTGSPLLPDTLAWFDCTLHKAVDAGDHTLFIGEVRAGGWSEDGSPLVYHNRQWGTFTALEA